MNLKIWNETNNIIERWLNHDGDAKVFVNLIENNETRLMSELKTELINEDIRVNMKALLECVSLDEFKTMLDTAKVLTNTFDSNTRTGFIRIYFNDSFFNSFIEFEIKLS